MPAPSAPRAQAVPLCSRLSKLSSDQSPGPVPAKAKAVAASTRLYSKPLLVLKNPLRRWTLSTAAVITPISPAATNGVSSPTAISVPPKNSAVPAAHALSLPGRSPTCSKSSPVPSMPPPPNAPNSFWAPWAANTAPTTMRSPRSARSMSVPSSLSIQALTMSDAVVSRGPRLSAERRRQGEAPRAALHRERQPLAGPGCLDGGDETVRIVDRLAVDRSHQVVPLQTGRPARAALRHAADERSVRASGLGDAHS